jgi:hypothetical protein
MRDRFRGNRHHSHILRILIRRIQLVSQTKNVVHAAPCAGAEVSLLEFCSVNRCANALPTASRC